MQQKSHALGQFLPTRRCNHIVDKASHKAMVIGKDGEKLKLIGTDARRDMEKLFGGKVFLQIWVKVKRGWADDERTLKNLGFEP